MTYDTLTSATDDATSPSVVTNSARKRVCHVSMTLLTGGLERLLVDYGRFHDAEKYDLRFVALDNLGPPADDLRKLGFRVDTLGFGEVGKLKMISNLATLLREEQIDIVHTHNTYAHFYGTLAARKAGVSTIINSQHGRGCGDGWKDRLQFRIANLFADHIVGVSEDAARLCREQNRKSASKITHIWNGIDLDRFAYHGPAKSLTAISVARLSKVKDFPTLLRGVAEALPKVPGFKLKLVGDGAERVELEKLSHELGLDNVVEFLGERNDVPQLLQQVGFFVSSSKTEGISLTLLEAMAVGLPILTTNVGGNPEIVQQDRTGLLVEPLNPDAIAAGIIEMCRNQESWPVMGELARQRVEQHFNVRAMIRSYEELYEGRKNSGFR